MKNTKTFTQTELDLLFNALDTYAQEIRALYDSGIETKKNENKIQKNITKLEAKLETL